MAKLNTRPVSTGPASVLTSSYVPGARTNEGAPGAVSDTRTELFRLGSVLFFAEKDTFYESGNTRDQRFIKLVEKVALEDPTWMYNFLRWLRTEGNIRTASIVGAAHAVHARLKSRKANAEDELLSSLGMMGVNRAIVAAVLVRADEPGEFVSYWRSKFGVLPKPVKRGIADAVNRLYNEYSVMKYDTASHAYRFADILNLTHAKARKAGTSDMRGWADGEEKEFYISRMYDQGDLFKYIIDSRYDQVAGSYKLPTIRANKELRAEVAAGNYKSLLDPAKVKAAGMTWEDVLSLGGKNLDKKKMWEAVIPSMGVMALIRNIRNFEEAGISPETRKSVIDKISDPEVIKKSRLFPYRFLAAYDNVNGLQYKAALEQAVEHATANIPELSGNTLVLVDVSGSMESKASGYTKVSMRAQASLFGAILAARNQGHVDLVAFGSSSVQIAVKPGMSALPLSKEIEHKSRACGGGTETAAAVAKHYDPKKHKRVIILTDMQSFGSGAYHGYYSSYYGSRKTLADYFDAKTFVYAFDLAGYKVTDLATGSDRKYQLGGLTDATFRSIPVLEAGHDGQWPWVTVRNSA